MSSRDHVDGNAVAGTLAEVFGIDVTAATGTCAGCHQRAAIAELPTWVGGPGIVMRCPGCSTVLVQVVTAPTRSWVQMAGLRSLELPVAR